MSDILFTSSVHVYGDTSGSDKIICPEDEPNPNDWYAESKVESQKILNYQKTTLEDFYKELGHAAQEALT